MSQLPVPQGSLATYLVEINRFDLLSADDEHRLATRYQATGDIEAAQSLVTSNLRFVVKVAYEYAGYGLRMADLIQEGNIGLMIAVKKFDPSRGFRLISYAVWWIRAMIQNYILKSWSLVKIGTTQAQRKLFYKLGQTKRALSRLFKDDSMVLNEATNHAVAQSLDVRDEDVAEMDLRMKNRDSSLDQPFREDSDTTPLDLLSSTAASQEDLMMQQEEKNLVGTEVRRALTVLNDKERYIIEKRLLTDEPMTLQEIGNRYQISRERARQLEERAKKKLRQALSSTVLAEVAA